MKFAVSIVAIVALVALVANGVRDSNREFSEALVVEEAQGEQEAIDASASSIRQGDDHEHTMNSTSGYLSSSQGCNDNDGCNKEMCMNGGSDLFSKYKNHHKVVTYACWVSDTTCTYLPEASSKNFIWKTGMPPVDKSLPNEFEAVLGAQEACQAKDGDLMDCMCGQIRNAEGSDKKADCKCKKGMTLWCNMDQYESPALDGNRKWNNADILNGQLDCRGALYCSKAADQAVSEALGGLIFGKDTPLLTEDPQYLADHCSGKCEPQGLCAPR